MEEEADVFKEKVVSRDGNAAPTSFKKPVMPVIGKRPGLAAHRSAAHVTLDIIEKSKNKSDEELPNWTANSDEKSSIHIKIPNNVGSERRKPSSSNIVSEVDYEPPPSNIPTGLYKLEVLKNGRIIQTEDLIKKPYYIFGRLPSCDLVLEHPSISRYHAVLQYQDFGVTDTEKGWYLFDLDSTHGTFLNKKRIPSQVYTRIHSGHTFKFGASTRLFILQGPEEDQEPESQYSVTELKEQQKQYKEQLINKQEKEMISTLASISVETSSSGINWGMGEDAEDENPSSENPFAIIEELNEDLYLDDPKKTLRGWFEREGYELEYKVEEKSYANFVCRVELPIDNVNGVPIVAEASVKIGKKKEAVVQCALEACRILDRHGLLRQSKHESKVSGRKRTHDEDYYSSDEDIFLDRTGAAERKRQARLRGKNSETVETYDSLVLKWQQTGTEMTKVREDLDKATADATPKSAKIDTDDLDAYMATLQAVDPDSKKKVAGLKSQLSYLQREEVKLKMLMDVARPIHLPPVTSLDVIAQPEKSELVESSVAHIAQHTINGKEDLANQEDSSSRIGSPLKPLKKTPSLESREKLPSSADLKETPASKCERVGKKEEADGASTEQTASLPDHTGNVKSDEVGLVIRKKKKKAVVPRRKVDAVPLHLYSCNTAKYDTWVPPENQSGDGKTELNKKLGY